MRMIVLLVLAGFSAPATVFAVASCPDKAPAAITAVGDAALKCQETIAKESGKYLKTKLKTLSSCKTKNAAGACPTAGDTTKLHSAAAKAAEKITKTCGTDAAQAALTSTYNGSTDDTIISSCVLGQHSVVADFVSAETIGVTTEDWPGTGKERAACIKEVAKNGAAIVASLQKNAASCLKTQMKNAVAGDLAPVCVGSFSGGAFVPPTDPNTAAKQAGVFTKIDAKVASKCGAAAGLAQIATMFGCAGSESVADLQACLTCTGFNAMADAITQEFSESGTYVANGANALTTAFGAASTGQKLLIAPGDYPEEALITTDGLQVVGCGAASDQRPRIIPAATVTTGRGIRAFGVDGLVFQSLATFDQDNDGIFVQGAHGVTFRDIHGDGNFHSRYAVFPIQSDDILIELCVVRAVADAGLYVGQSGKTMLRHNDVRTSVASIEFENTVNGTAYGNYAFDNTGGMLMFKDNDLIDQSSCHDVHHNVFEGNNRVNIGAGTVAGVPDGTGVLVIANDSTLVDHNIFRDHRTFGYAQIGQGLAGFTPVDPDPVPDYMTLFDNVVTNNGYDPHPLGLGAGGDLVIITPGTGSCSSNNTVSVEDNGSVILPDCTLPPPAFAACPAPFTIP